MSRARYFRGHNVHSPFVYSLVRQVFMRSKPMSDDRSFIEALVARGVSEKRAVQLHNLCVHCGYSSRSIDDAESDCSFMCVSANVEPARIAAFAGAARKRGATLAVIAPYKNREREAACREIVAAHTCTTVDNRAYLLIFNNHLPKQHFRL